MDYLNFETISCSMGHAQMIVSFFFFNNKIVNHSWFRFSAFRCEGHLITLCIRARQAAQLQWCKK